MNNKCPIAVVGVSAIFPGASNASMFWNNIVSGKDEIREIPSTHWLIDDYYSADPNAPDKTYAKHGAFIDEVGFDCLEFGILPAQLQDTDTIQLLALIVAQSVLRDAANGDFQHLDRSRMSVILGCAGGTEQMVQMGARMQRPIWVKSLREAGIAEEKVEQICDRIADHYTPWTEAVFPGMLGNVVAGRIANSFNLGGTNCVVDAACASSSSALMMAIQELYLGHSDMVITGGADALNDITMFMCFSKTPALSPTHEARPFSDQADGTILGEGVGMLALRRLDDAESDGDTIYAVIKGVGSSSDGSGTAVYAPVAAGQAEAIKRAYSYAGFAPDTVELIEAHGTGTKAGDKAEFHGLKLAFDSAERSDKQWCALGSVKSQIGHTKGAAGAASLIKTVMALHHKVLPPTIKVEQPNAAFQIEQTPFYLNTVSRPWVRDQNYPRRAGVSSFGFGGSNYHIALEEYVKPQTDTRRMLGSKSHLLLVSATSLDQLSNRIEALWENLPDDQQALEYLARSSQNHFDHTASHRLAIVAESLSELRVKFKSCRETIRNKPDQSCSSPAAWYYGCSKANNRSNADQEANKVALVFPGQGSQYLSMGADLAMGFPAAMAVWDRAAEHLFDNSFTGKKNTAENYKLQQVVFPVPVFDNNLSQQQMTRLNQTEWAQPAIAAMSLSLWEILKQMGLAIDGTAGHSFGELTALHVAGAFDEHSLLCLARKRGELMATAAESQKGAMLVVSAEVKEVQTLLNQVDQGIALANINSPRQVVVSGAEAAIVQFEKLCADRSIQATRLPVSTAFHSHIVADALAPFAAQLETVDFEPLTLPVYANVTAKKYPETTQSQKQILSQQLAATVRFAEQIQRMFADGYRTFVEVGPGNTLTNLIRDCLPDEDIQTVNLDQKNRNGLDSLWRALAQLSAAGLALDYDVLWKDIRDEGDPRQRTAPRMSLPISGINYNRRYPPQGGSQALPKPVHGETQGKMSPAAVPQATIAQSNEQAPVSLAQAVSQRFRTAPDSATAEPAKAGAPAQTVSGVASSTASLQEQKWLDVFEKIQQQMHETHREFLQVSQQALQQLGQFNAGQQAAHASPPVKTERSLATASSLPMNLQVTANEPIAVPQPASAENARSQSSSFGKAEIDQLLMAVVSDKTGYPSEMLALEMELDGDLGIDSIKRVEIFAAVVEKIPGLPEVDPGALATLRTLQDVVYFVSQAFPDVEAPQDHDDVLEVLASADALPELLPSTIDTSIEHSVNVKQLLLNVVADKTGYPISMLDLSMKMDADLGIDSIKRVEILASTKDELTDFPELDPVAMASLVTLADVADYLERQIKAGSLANSVQILSKAQALAESKDGKTDNNTVVRYEVQLEHVNAPGLMPERLAHADTVVITPAESAIGDALSRLFAQRSVKCVRKDQLDAQDRHVICLEGLAKFRTQAESIAVNETVFQHACRIAATQEAHGGIFVVLQNSRSETQQNNPGPRNINDHQAWSSGLSALVKSAALEWPDTLTCSIDIRPGNHTPDELAKRIMDELCQGGATKEVVLADNGMRLVPALVPCPVVGAEFLLSPRDVLIVSGGARGVTAASIKTLCAHLPLRVVLLGRTEISEDAEKYAQGFEDEALLMQALLEEGSRSGQTMTPMALKNAVARIRAVNEINDTLAALQTLGTEARYIQCDITTLESLNQALSQVRQVWGPISGVVHGAGVLADKLLSSKTLDHYHRVFTPKVVGLANLIAATNQDPLKTVALFSSVVARAGNAGQSDYAMANEILNRMAAKWRSQSSAHVVSINWGPWESGMVNAALEEQFTQSGIALIPLAEGAERFVDELRRQANPATEVVIGDASLYRLTKNPERQCRHTFIAEVDPRRQPQLESHRIRGDIVVPVVQVVDWFVGALDSLRPANHDIILQDIKVLKGISLDNDLRATFVLAVEESFAEDNAGSNFCVLSLLDHKNQKRYCAEVTDCYDTDSAAIPALFKPEACSSADSLDCDAYLDTLFHGPLFSAIKKVENICKSGAVARLVGGESLGWASDRGTVDQAMLDGALQLANLWAHHQLKKSSLPVSIQRLHIAHRGYVSGEVTCQLVGHKISPSGIKADLRIVDHKQQTMASIEGLQMIPVDGSLK